MLPQAEEEILKNLKLEDLQAQHREIAEVIGIKGMLQLIGAFGGNAIYFPQKRELLRNKVYASIYREYDGSNIRELATRYGVSERTVYNLVQDKICKGNKIPGQLTMADMDIFKKQT